MTDICGYNIGVEEKKSFFNSVYAYLVTVPRGKVVTYGQIARALGRPNMSRYVGYALHVNPEPVTIPCHRVVNREGRLSGAFAFGGLNEQKRLLESEGVRVDGDKVDLREYGYDGD